MSVPHDIHRQTVDLISPQLYSPSLAHAQRTIFSRTPQIVPLSPLVVLRTRVCTLYTPICACQPDSVLSSHNSLCTSTKCMAAYRGQPLHTQYRYRQIERQKNDKSPPPRHSCRSVSEYHFPINLKCPRFENVLNSTFSYSCAFCVYVFCVVRLATAFSPPALHCLSSPSLLQCLTPPKVISALHPKVISAAATPQSLLAQEAPPHCQTAHSLPVGHRDYSLALHLSWPTAATMTTSTCSHPPRRQHCHDYHCLHHR
mmetsp:Transcript_23856/g.38300  ORF Transcript_23856/g.38300 Transcript_23856/m.38300 type:complete len:257 (+) Transcript_23856:208-978(+)